MKSNRRIKSLMLAMLFFIMTFINGFTKTVSAAANQYNFDFGGGGTQNGFIGVSAQTGYDRSRGYGFNQPWNMANVKAAGRGELSDAVQFKNTSTANTFNVDLDKGLYEVTVTLGNTNRTSIWAEGCLQIMNMTGNNATHTFQIPVTDGQLNIMAKEGKSGYAFTMSSLKLKKLSDNPTMKPTIWICGDSTVCNYYPLNSSVQAGWGQVLNKYIDNNKWQVRNMAASGQYAKGFINAGQFEPVLKYGNPGDIYFISIGINDTNYSNASEYHDSVYKMAKAAKDKGMKVILVKQQGRCNDASRKPLLTGRWFGGELDKVGSELNLQVIDLFNLAQNYFLSIGQDRTTALYMKGDTLHPNRQGAEVLASLVAKQVDFNENKQVKKEGYYSIYIAGDSTVQSYKASYAPQQGWGYYLSDFIGKNYKVDNRAIAGRSSKSFYDNGRLESILSTIQKGDYLLVEFGINDAGSSKPERYAPVCGNVQNPKEGSFEFYVKKYVEGAKSKGAVPILISPTLGLKAYANGRFVNSYTNYAEAMKSIARAYNVPYIDLNSLMVQDYNKTGYDKAKLYHLYGVVNGSKDMTHFSEAGAKNAARLVSIELNKVIGNSEVKDIAKQGAEIKEGKYRIKNLNSGLYLDVNEGKAANGTNVQQWAANSVADNNTWTVKSQGNGYYKIYSEVGDKSYLLDLNYGKADNGTNIQIYQDSKSDAQQFKFVKADNNSYVIYTKASKDASCLDVYEASTKNGANVCQWTSNGGKNQMWVLEEVKDSNNNSSTPNVPSNPEVEDKPVQEVINNSALLSYKYSNWGSSFQTDFTITNKGKTACKSWRLKLKTADFDVSSSWNVELKKSGDEIVIIPAAWQAELAPNASAAFGMISNGLSKDLISYTLELLDEDGKVIACSSK